MILAPTTPVSPFAWTQMFASRVGGRSQENYYRWLALTYVTTLCTNPAASLPCGTDEAGMPFGLQVIGPFRGDRRTLDMCEAMEAAFSRSTELCRPRPDLQKLAHTSSSRRCDQS
jgi:Asp-tRNA(Asn)/Glu-tRNA(Gln) amidotransferase A subunit family amidase